MKAVVVFEMPDGIDLDQYKGFLTVDRFYTTDEEIGTKIDAEPMKFGWMKIKPLPQHRKPSNPDETWEEMHQRWGWNHCIDTITGEKDGL